MNEYTLTNDFHNTTVKVRCESLSHIHNEIEIKMSKGQMRKCWEVLCGIDSCTCSGIAGTRGVQRDDRGRRIVIDMSEIYSAK